MADTRRFVIPDIHGCARTFGALLERIGLSRDDTLFLLGDYVDRGPRSREVIETIMRLQAEGYNVRPVRGNHEEMLATSCLNRELFYLWIINGGHTTLQSFGVEDACELPHDVLRFIRGLPYYIELDDAILVHAGLNFELLDPFSDTESMIWRRKSDYRPEPVGGRLLVCGHTPTRREVIEKSLDGPVIVLDNGCVYAGEGRGLGSLTCLELNAKSLVFQENIDF